MNKKVNIVTLGCSKNIVDSEKLLRQLSAGGFELIHNSDDYSAGTVIINTCGFINDAKEESIDTILRFVKAKQRGLIRNLYVMGCLAERYMNDLRSEIPEVHNYFGVNDFSGILKEMGLSLRDDLLTERMLTGPDHFAYLKISEGCNRTCAFCAIPLIRGNYSSRSIEDLLIEADSLVSTGVKELILIAQDLSYYGIDLYKKQKLTELVNGLLKINSMEWLRLHYLYPAAFPLELLEIINDNPRICRYIDIPVQHISDNMLEKMRRSHNRRDTVNLLETIRKKIPEVAIRTTLISGYPGESDKDHRELVEFIKDFRFERLGVFPYSHEEETYAYKHYEDDIPQELKQERVDEIMAVQQEISLEKNKAIKGRVLKVIIDKIEGEYFYGRTEFDSPEVDQEVLISSAYKLSPGNFYEILITDTSEFDLYGIPAKSVS